ncbi:hypothetical protein T492DRAFT_850846 [Pavlovales sp. CCMP2436]|nr:hypothetical protein T492DRAFT_850846 [Pavlovales sp. CCMP2436]
MRVWCVGGEDGVCVGVVGGRVVCVENNNYAILLATSPLTAFDKGGATARMSNIGGAADALAGAAGFGLSLLEKELVGVGGKDLYDGNRTYILAVIWQLMRFHLLNFIQVYYYFYLLRLPTALQKNR